MSAPVRIEAEAWDDLRFRTLARLLGMADGDLALIKCGRLWSWQAEHYTPDAPTYVVDSDTIDSALGVSGAAAAMVRAKLADEVPEGYRVRGAEGRIEWLWQRRQAARAGGEATKRKRSDKEAPGGSPLAPPPGEPNASPLVLVMDLVPDHGDQKSDAPAPRDPAVPAGVPAKPPATVPVVVPPGQSAWHRRLRWWGGMLEADQRIRAAGIEPNAGQLSRAPAGLHEQNMNRCERQLLDGGASPDEVDAKMRHIVLVAEAEALRDGHRRWFKPALIWDPVRAMRSVDTSLDEARTSAPRAGPRGSAERAPTKKTPVQNLMDDIARREAAGET